MAKNVILICDDRAATRTKWRDALRAIPEVDSEFRIEMLGGSDLDDTLSGLEERRRKAGNDEDLDHDEGPIDGAHVFVIDYDLRDALPGVTGERLSYLARCYSNCGVIVALNQFEGVPTFDLTLRGHPESFADLNLHSSVLAFRGLWVSKGVEDFRPWAWPLLPRTADSFPLRVQDVLSDPKRAVVETLSLGKERAPLLSRQVASFLGGTERAEDTTFDEFVQHSGNGLRGSDKAGPTARARIAASRVSKWLERLVLPGQDVLVDAPHLVSRYPSLLKNDSAAADWSATAAIPRPGKRAPAVAFDANTIVEHVYEHEHWVSRPLWYWAGVSLTPEIKEVSDPWSAKEQPYAFCEDTSRFHDPSETRPFQPLGPTTFIKRFVLKKKPAGSPTGLRYLPLDHFADLD